MAPGFGLTQYLGSNPALKSSTLKPAHLSPATNAQAVAITCPSDTLGTVSGKSTLSWLWGHWQANRYRRRMLEVELGPQPSTPTNPLAGRLTVETTDSQRPASM